MVDIILEHLEMYFPSISENMVSYEYDGGYGITILSDDGRKLYYDDLNNAIRYLPSNKDALTEDEYRIEFGYRLRNMMGIKGINQLELSNRTGISQPQLSNYMSGKNTPSNYIVRKIARALDCSIDELSYM